MRDKYIEVIKEYIRQKPQYKETLDKIKEDSLLLGATEEEFEEAIRQMEAKPAKASAKYSNKLERIILLSHKAKRNKEVLASFSMLFISLVLAVVFLPRMLFNQPKSVSLSDASLATKKSFAQNPFPVVYASSKAIDAEKVFSIPYKETVSLSVTGKPKKDVLGFFPYWMLEKQDKINISYLSSVSLFALTVNGRGDILKEGESGLLDPGWDMWRDPRLDDFIRKAKRSNVKVYLTFKSFNNSDIERLSKLENSQKAFIANALFLINSKNLDGINIDFEYVGIPDTTVRDGFTRFVTNLNYELKRQLPDSSLTIDTYLTSGARKDLFDITSLSLNSDALIIMGYDMHTPNGDAGPISAMGGDTNIVGYVQNYLEKADSSKLILAVPYYGYDWPQEPNDNSEARVKTLPYAEIEDMSKNLQLFWNEESQTPYFSYKEDGVQRVVHFDNVRSLGVKYDFIKTKNLKGVGIWALGYDGLRDDLEKLIVDKFISE